MVAILPKIKKRNNCIPIETPPIPSIYNDKIKPKIAPSKVKKCSLNPNDAINNPIIAPILNISLFISKSKNCVSGITKNRILKIMGINKLSVPFGERFSIIGATIPVIKLT